MNRTMEKKILYIRLDSSPLPEACNEMIVKDFNLESYFCALLGRRLLEDTGLGGSMLYPGKLVADFEKANKEAYREIIQQWEKILSTLLISQSENDKDFIVDLPSSYIGWLNRCDIPYAFQIRNYYIHTRSVSIKRKYLFEIVHEVLKNKLDCFLQKNKGIIDRIAFSIDGISRDCYIIHLWKHIITRDYKIITINEFYYKIWEKDKFCIHNVILGETLLEKIRQIHASKDDNAVFWDNIQNPLFSKEWFAALNSSDVVNLYTIKRNRDLPVSLKRIGFDWKMSYLDLENLLDKLNFDTIVDRDPCVLNGCFGKYFCARIIARTKDCKLLFTFDYNNEDGLGGGGVTEKSQDTLNAIIVQIYNKEEYDIEFLLYPFVEYIECS